MNRQELERIGKVLNCGGEGGKPGPCPLVGTKSSSQVTRPRLRPDGAMVIDVPKDMSVSTRRELKMGMKVDGQYHDIQGVSKYVSGKVVGFVPNRGHTKKTSDGDVVIRDARDAEQFYFVAEKNVRRRIRDK